MNPAHQTSGAIEQFLSSSWVVNLPFTVCAEKTPSQKMTRIAATWSFIAGGFFVKAEKRVAVVSPLSQSLYIVIQWSVLVFTLGASWGG